MTQTPSRNLQLTVSPQTSPAMTRTPSRNLQLTVSPQTSPAMTQTPSRNPTVDSEPANFSQTEGDTSGRGVDEEQALASASLLSSFRPLVAWEVCTTDIDLKTDEESVPCKTQLSGGSESKASEGGGGTREEQLANAGNNDTGLFFAKDDKQEENINQKLCTRGRDEMPENEEYEEHVNATLTGDAVSEDMEKSARGAEETEKAPHDPQKMDETIQVKEADDKMQLEDEQHLQAEDTDVKLCQIAGLSLGEEDNMHVEEVKVQRNEADEEVENSDGVPKLAFENECDKGTREAENQLSVCEELSDDHRDFNEVPGFASQHVELQMTYDKSSIVSEDELIVVEQERVMAHWSESVNDEDAKEKG
ncbi:uncharacterized protein LOC121959072 [Plectropomus leopardus]|uniref:uncharacterized protein LOC121959072 n=1 Tax=Plectropomus leopardus TaxID=160734 RepID=UPI001C4C1FB6|nr:uncharacterized protein LOC121959072 [Plectropomus leopardus]